MRGVNLIPTRYLAARRRRVRTRRWAVGVAAYALLLLPAWGVMRMTSGGAQRVAAEQLAQADDRIADTEAALRTIQPRLAAALATLEAGNSVGDQPDWSILMTAVANLLGDDAVLTRFALEPVAEDKRSPRPSRQYVLHVQGLGRSHEVVSGYVLKLEGLGLFDSVKLLSTKREPIAEQTAVGFQIDCTMGAAAP